MIGTTISHYKIIEKIGSGGMGIVYKAHDIKLRRFVALKFLPPDCATDATTKERFIHEAQSASTLQHSSICTIHEINETEDGQMFIVMDYYQGKTLKSKIEDGRLNIDEIIDITLQIAQGLRKAHDNGIIHRDIKPANIMLTNESEVKILDFGLAKFRGQTKLTKLGSTLGTIAYMAPEQAKGETVDQRADIWSLGAVMYEMVTGQLPFKGDYDQAVMYCIMNEDPIPIRTVNPAVTPGLESIINRALIKNRDLRYSTATVLIKDLKYYQNSLHTERKREVSLRTIFRFMRMPKIVIPALAVFLALIVVTVWFFNRQAKIRWAKEEALPEIERQIAAAWWDYTDIYQLAKRAERYIPDDPQLAQLLSKCSFHISIQTDPPGAHISVKNYKTPNSEWNYLGVSPLEQIRLPIGIFRWKMEKEGFETVMAAASTWDLDLREKNVLFPKNLFRILDEKGEIPSGMVRVPGAETEVGKIEDFFIDTYEVTNKRYKRFIDAGGYRNAQYWKNEFIKAGKLLTRTEAIAWFVDQTDRPGPATWQAGNYPDGQEEYPVSGISWYEAAAYAEFEGKSLPTKYHWGLARGEATPLIRWPHIGGFAVFAPFSNFNGNSPVPTGSLPGITSFGVYDMAGNVREWCWNKTQNGRLIRGGAWNDVTYMFGNLSQAPAFDRSSENGFRCVLCPDAEKIPESALEMVTFGIPMDYYKTKPVSDAVYQVYKEQFSYDKTPLNAHLEVREESLKNWIHERITLDAAYNDEHIIAHLFLPKNTNPPFQTVIYFPGAGARYQESSADLENYFGFRIFLSFILKNGRAVLFPVFKGTFERRLDDVADIFAGKNTYQYTEYMIQLVKDFKRCIDYIETRSDIDRKKLAYYGISWGADLGAIIPAVEERLKASILIAGGFYGNARAEAHQINYVTRVRVPTLMLNGRYDTVSHYETSIKPMFDLLGTSAENKELKLYDTDHLPPRNEFIKETLAWLDSYLGPVQ